MDGKAFYTWYNTAQKFYLNRGLNDGDQYTIRVLYNSGEHVWDTTLNWSETDNCYRMNSSENCNITYPKDRQFVNNIRWLFYVYSNSTWDIEWQLLYNGVPIGDTVSYHVYGYTVEHAGSHLRTGDEGTFVTEPLKVRVNGYAGSGQAGENVRFTLSSTALANGFQLYASSPIGTSVGASSVTVPTDNGGYAEVYARLGNGGLTATVVVSSINAPVDPPYFSGAPQFGLISQSTTLPGLDQEENLGEDQAGRGGGNPCDNRNSALVGNPINVVTGNKYEKEKDISGRSASPIDFIRYYNSKDLGISALGHGWRHTYDRSIIFSKEGRGKNAINYAKLKRQDGKGITFVDTGSGYRSDPDHGYVLTKRGGKWELRTPVDDLEVYDGKGNLLSISDIRGNTLTLKQSKGQLLSVTSNSGERIAFFYNELDQLERVEYAASNQDSVLGETQAWAYGYTDGRLTSVVNPDGTQSVRCQLSCPVVLPQ